MRISKIFTGFFLLFQSLLVSSQNELKAPKPKQNVVCDTLHNDVRCDEYHWMREKSSPEVINHLYAENGYADLYMKDHSLLIKKIYEELKDKIVEDIQSQPSRDKGYLYYTRYEKGKNYPSYFRKRDTIDAKEVLLLNIDSLAKTFMNFNLGALSISPSAAKMLYGVDTKGDRLIDVYFKEIHGDIVLNDTLKQVSSVSWFGEDAVIYTLPEEKSKRSFKAYKHILNTPQSQDELIAFEPDPTFQLSFSRSVSERFIFMGSTSTLSSEFSFFDFQNPDKGFQLISQRAKDHVYSPSHVTGDYIIIQTDLDAPNGKLVKAPIKNPEVKNWIEIIPHREDVLIAGVSFYSNRLFVVEQFDARQQLVEYDLMNNKKDTIQMPDEPLSISLSTFYEFNESTLRYSFSSMRLPSETWDYNLVTKEKTRIHVDSINGGYNASKYITERVYAKQQDGVSIPITLVYKKGLKRDGNNPAWITAYGAYGASSMPGFSNLNISLADRGFVVATAHIRGGSDCGMQWYDDGKLFKKKNTFLDFIACTKELINMGYTKSEKTVIQGGSAGGLLMGAVLNIEPQLFGVAIANVPFVDVINTMLDETLPLTTFEYDEWGNPNDSAYYHYIKSYAPYENVTEQNYPPILATAGYNDSQVPYWEPAKWVARLRTTKTDNNTILFKTNMEAGHGGSSGRYSRLKDAAFELAFAFQSIGIKENYITVNGETRDSDGNLLPFVNVYIEGTTIATASNENGQFSLVIRKDVDPVLVFSSIGFKKVVIPITINSDIRNIKASLQAENYQLKTFEVKANAKDPAYAVMKKAIDKRKFHLNQVDAFSSDIYIKSSVRLDQIPEKLPFFISKNQMPDSSDLGLVYLSESVARYHEKQPDLIKEEMLASKVAGLKQGFSWNRVSDVLMNFYENLVGLNYYSDRGFVSPVSESGMFYYKYKMLGTFMENGQTINKIRIEPRRKHDPCFRGEVYIVDDTWNIHSVDLMLTKDAQIEFVDTLFVRQEYVEMEQDLWMPLTLQLMSNISVFGFSAVDKSIGVFSNYRINPPFDKRFFGNEVFRIQEEANKKDTVFWEDTRPMTLTQEELENYRKADSTEAVQTSKPYLDSLDKVNNKVGIVDLLFRGVRISNSFVKKYWNVNPAIAMISFNTSEGFFINPEIRRTIVHEDKRLKRINGNIRYGFSDYRWKGDLSYYTLTKPFKFNWWHIKAGRSISQFNNNNPIQPIVNAGYSLLDKRNLIRIYEKTGAEIVWNREIVNGFMVQARASWYNRIVPRNNTDFSYSSKDESYSSNRENHIDVSSLESASAGINIKASYRFQQKYETKGNRKIIVGAKWPMLMLEYDQAISNILGSNIQYSRLEFSISDKINAGLIGDLSFKVIAGTFLDTSSMNFIDNRHFNGNETFFIRNFNSEYPNDLFRNRLNSFNALSYYSRSTNSNFVEIHVEHDFSNWIFNKIPLLRLAKLQTVLGTNMLITESNPIYTELYVGISNILKVLRLDFVSQLEIGKPIKPLLRIGIDL